MKTTIPKALFVIMTMEVVLTTTFATQGKVKTIITYYVYQNHYANTYLSQRPLSPVRRFST